MPSVPRSRSSQVQIGSGCCEDLCRQRTPSYLQFSVSTREAHFTLAAWVGRPSATHLLAPSPPQPPGSGCSRRVLRCC